MKYRSEEGQAIVLTAVCLTALLGFMALALDIGLIFRAKRNLQIAADAAATAGALDLSHGLDYSNGATLSLAKNTEVGLEPATFTVLASPPTDGPNAGTKGYVEVVLTQSKPTMFMNMFSRSNMAISARAVAGTPSYVNNCGWLMGTTGPNITSNGSNAEIDDPGCSIYLNATTKPWSTNGNPTSFASSAYNMLSKDQSGSPGKSHWDATMNWGVPPQTPILPTTTAGPKIPADCTINYGSATLSGTYPATAPAAGTVVCFTNATGLNVNGATTLRGAAGDGVVYVFENGLNISTNSAVNIGYALCTSSTGACTDTSKGDTFSGTLGAVVDIQGGGITMGSSSLVSVYAPTSGTYNGIAIFQPYTNPTTMQLQFGSTSTYLDGMIFAPSATMNMHDAGGGVKATGFVLKSLNMNTSSLDITSYSASNQYTTPLRVITLVE
jgi:Flp pilus assembly protein TadG